MKIKSNSKRCLRCSVAANNTGGGSGKTTGSSQSSNSRNTTGGYPTVLTIRTQNVNLFLLPPLSSSVDYCRLVVTGSYIFLTVLVVITIVSNQLSIYDFTNRTFEVIASDDSNTVSDEDVVVYVNVNNNNGRNNKNPVGIKPRIFQPIWNTTIGSVPCLPPEENWISVKVQQTPTKEGIFYLKPHKTGSSTSAGINLRIARNLALRQQIQQQQQIQPEMQQQVDQNITNDIQKQQEQEQVQTQNGTYNFCKARFQHGRASSLYMERDINKSILWTMLRDPTKRVISSFFHFAVSRQNVTPTDENFQKYIQQKGIGMDYYIRYLDNNKKIFDRSNRRHKRRINATLHSIIHDQYNLIGITERMDESAVVLMMLLNVSMSDILYLRSKSNGGYDGGANFKCTYITPSYISPGMEQYFQSREWYNIIKYDLALYEAVNKSLDITIDQIGRDIFDINLRKFQNANRIAEERCRNITIFPCDSMGRYHRSNETDCLWSDSGCGTSCLDDVATELQLW